MNLKGLPNFSKTFLLKEITLNEDQANCSKKGLTLHERHCYISSAKIIREPFFHVLLSEPYVRQPPGLLKL